MTKKYKGKTCAYCGDAVSDTADHVFAREFFLESDRDQLPKAPACESCNRRKADLEHYATALLPFGGRHAAAASNLTTMVPKRLQKNAPLRREIAEGMRQVMTREGASRSPSLVIPVDTARIADLFRLIARGLVWCEFKTVLASDTVVELTWLNAALARHFEDEIFAPHGDYVVTRRLGNDTVVYQGLQTSDCDQASVWRIAMYGGLWFAAEAGGPDAIASTIGVFTRPRLAPRAEPSGT